MLASGEKNEECNIIQNNVIQYFKKVNSKNYISHRSVRRIGLFKRYLD